jgi:hypothetical protein
MNDCAGWLPTASSSISALAAGERSATSYVSLYLRYPVKKRLGGSQSQSGCGEEKIPLASPCTDCTIPAPVVCEMLIQLPLQVTYVQ